MLVYYASGLWFERGETVYPGNWGRVVLGAGSAHRWFPYELFFEGIRRQTFADRPSRLHSLMASGTLADAMQWVSPERHLLYELEIPCSNPFQADVGWVNRIATNPAADYAVHTYDDAKDAAYRYWEGVICPDGQILELLIPDPAKVVSRVKFSSDDERFE